MVALEPSTHRMYRTPGTPIIHCPLCDVPHRLDAVRCDSCLQLLHEPVDRDALRSELLVRGRNAALGFAGVVGMVALTMAMTRVVVGVIYVPAFVWTLQNAKRFFGLRRWLAKAKREPPPARDEGASAAQGVPPKDPPASGSKGE